MAKRSKAKKITLIVLSSILGLLITAVILFFVFLDDIVNSRLNDLLKRKFGDFYVLEFDEIEKDIGFTDMTFVIKNARFSSDTTDIEGMEKFPIMFFQSQELRIENLSTWDILWGGELDMQVIELIRPDFKLYQRKGLEKKPDSKTTKKGKGLLTRLRLEHFHIEDGKVQILDFHSGRRVLLNDSIDFEVKGVDLDLNGLDQFKKALHFEDLNAETYHSKLTPLTGLYNFSLDSVRIDWQGHKMDFKNIRVDTKESLKESSKKKVNHSEVFNIFVEDVEVLGVDFDRLLHENNLFIDKVHVDGGEVHIFKNKLTRMETDFHKKVLNQIMRGIHFPVEVDSILLSNLDLDFELWAKSNKKPAWIELDNIHGSFANFNTKPEDQDTLNVRIQSELMQSGLLDMNVDIAIWDSINDYQKFWGNLRQMPFAVMNSTIRNFVNVKIVSGYVQRVDFSGYTNEWNSWGTIAFRYRDLAMDIYSFKDPNEKRKNKFLTGVAKMAIHKTNPLPNGDFRTASFQYKRERWEGSVMQWLGGLLVGMFKTTLKDMVLNIIKNENQKKIQQELKKNTKEKKKQARLAEQEQKHSEKKKKKKS